MLSTNYEAIAAFVFVFVVICLIVHIENKLWDNRLLPPAVIPTSGKISCWFCALFEIDVLKPVDIIIFAHYAANLIQFSDRSWLMDTWRTNIVHLSTIIARIIRLLWHEFTCALTVLFVQKYSPHRWNVLATSCWWPFFRPRQYMFIRYFIITIHSSL